MRHGLRTLLLLLLLLPEPLRADPAILELRPFLREGWLRVELRASGLLDERTESTVESGLPGSCLYGLTLTDREGRVAGHWLEECRIRLDLWEERYQLLGPGGEHWFETLAAADSAWAHLEALPLLPLAELREGMSYRLEVELRVQPLGAGARERLSRYVRRSSRADADEWAVDVGALLQRLWGRSAGPTDALHRRSAWFSSSELGGER